MAAPIRQFLSGTRQGRRFFTYLRTRVVNCMKQRVVFTGSYLCAVTVLSCDSKVKLKEPDASLLSREYLIKTASASSAEQSMVLLSQTALALQQAEKEYKEALLAVVFLMEYKLKVLGNPSEEARIWDLILEGRHLVSNTKKKRNDLQMLYGCVERLVNTAAEVTFITGADLVGSTANDQLRMVDQVIRDARLLTEAAEKKLIETELKTIETEGKYAEDHAEELAEEAHRINAGFTGPSGGGGTGGNTGDDEGLLGPLAGQEGSGQDRVVIDPDGPGMGVSLAKDHLKAQTPQVIDLEQAGQDSENGDSNSNINNKSTIPPTNTKVDDSGASNAGLDYGDKPDQYDKSRKLDTRKLGNDDFEEIVDKWENSPEDKASSDI